MTDNFFTSLSLLQQLRNRDLGLIGTIRKNRRELPEQFTSKRSEAAPYYLASISMQRWCHIRLRGINALCWFQVNILVRISTPQPCIILAYNKAKEGVDHLDQMCGTYTIRKRTLRWPNRVFQHIMDVSAFNAFVL